MDNSQKNVLKSLHHLDIFKELAKEAETNPTPWKAFEIKVINDNKHMWIPLLSSYPLSIFTDQVLEFRRIDTWSLEVQPTVEHTELLKPTINESENFSKAYGLLLTENKNLKEGTRLLLKKLSLSCDCEALESLEKEVENLRFMISEIEEDRTRHMRTIQRMHTAAEDRNEVDQLRHEAHLTEITELEETIKALQSKLVEVEQDSYYFKVLEKHNYFYKETGYAGESYYCTRSKIIESGETLRVALQRLIAEKAISADTKEIEG